MQKITPLILTLIIISCVVQCAKSPIEIGFMSNLSGRKSQLGTNARAGLSLAIEQINKDGGINGHPIVLIIKDHAGDRNKAEQHVQELVKKEIPLIIGPFLSTMAPTILKETEKANTIVFSPTVSSDRYSGIDDHFFRVISAATYQAKWIAKDILRKNLTSIVIVVDSTNPEYVGPIIQGATQMLSPHKIAVNIVGYHNKDSLMIYANQVQAYKPDGIIFATSGIDAAGITQQLYKNNYNAQLYGTMWTKLSKVELYGGKTVENMILVDSYKSAIPSKAEQAFNSHFRVRFDMEPSFAARFAYEVLFLYKRAATEAHSFNRAPIKKALTSIKNFQGLTDSYSFDTFGDVNRKFSLYQIVNNHYVHIPESN
ncbi:MAG: ABC transporter substrate-binding protein [Fibrobacterales bacterium]